MDSTLDSLSLSLEELKGCMCSSSNVTTNQTYTCESTTAIETDFSRSNPYYRYIEDILYTRVSTGICIFGLIGNICNLFVLIPQGRHCSMGRIEKFAYWGLVSLSISDACCCLLVIPHLFVEADPMDHMRLGFSVLYAAYGQALLSVFSMVSTWLTVITAIGRYLAICHPFKARELIGMTVAKRAWVLVYCACFAFSIPRFLTYKVERIDCEKTQDSSAFTIFFRWPGSTHAKTDPLFEAIYNWIYFIVGSCIPFVFLVFSNSFLVRALRRARTKLKLIRAVEVCSVDQYRPITLTLVVLVLMHVVLVSPSEFVMFFRQRFTQIHDAADDGYNVLAAIANTLKAINFSVNFILYYIINVHFRRAFAAVVACKALKCRAALKRGSTKSRATTTNGSLTLQTCSMSTRIGQQLSSDTKRFQIYFDSSPF